MKKLYKYMVSLAVLLLSATITFAQYHEAGGIATKKTAELNGNTYTITLENYATGSSTPVTIMIPSDIVLVLDVSGSMNERISTNRKWEVKDFEFTSNYDIQYNGRKVGVENGVIGYYKGKQFIPLSNASGTWTGTLSWAKIDALKCSVHGFVDEVKKKNEELNAPSGQGSQIAIVKYAMDTYCNGDDRNEGTTYDGQYNDIIDPGNHIYQYITYDWMGFPHSQDVNVTEVLCSFAEVTATGATELKSSINAVKEGGATAVDFGLTKAKWLFEDIKETFPTKDDKGRTIRGKSVVVFTDGEPNHPGETFLDKAAGDAVNIANELKTTYEAKVFSIGVFDKNYGDNDKVTLYMNHMSSNFPDATASGYSDTGTSGNITYTGEQAKDKDGNLITKYYQNASNQDLAAVFATIAGETSGATATLGEETQVKDVVSSSFKLPDDVKQENITNYVKVFTSEISTDGNDWGTWTPFNDAEISYTASTKTLDVTGFDYTADDNWVGERFQDGRSLGYKGKKLVIQFDIEVEGDVTGGMTSTNSPKSGIYIKGEDGKYQDEPINAYQMPEKVLSMTLKIQKTGLRVGESATFVISKTDPKKDDQGNIMYNAIGKPIPDETKWTEHSRVILSNMGSTNGQRVEKVLVGLNPNYVYKIEEGDWSWTYTTEGEAEGTQTTSSVAINPFKFTNTEKTDRAKHGEAVSVNRFGSNYGQESKKSNKKAN